MILFYKLVIILICRLLLKKNKIMLINSFIPHFFLISSFLLLLIANVLMVRSRDSYHRIFFDELFTQTTFTLFSVLILIFSSKVYGFSADYNFKVSFGSNLIQAITVIFMLLSLPSITLSFRLQKLNFFEFFIIMQIVLLSLFFIVNANSLLALFVSIELFALCSIIFVSFKKTSAFSTEAGLKYFIYSAIFSSIFLLGCGCIYVICGSVNFDTIFYYASILQIDSKNDIYFIFQLGILLISCWFLFKLTSAPFHSWASEVYDGAPLAATIFLSIVPKFPLILVFAKWNTLLLTIFFDQNSGSTLYFCGLLSCLIGFFSALGQPKLKKLFIFSSIGNLGYIISLAYMDSLNSQQILVIFALIYFFTAVVTWSIIALLYLIEAHRSHHAKDTFRSINLTMLIGLYSKNKSFAIIIAIVMFSLSGIPPMLGFFAKFQFFSALVSEQFYGSAIFFIFLGSIAVFYYIQLIEVMFFTDTSGDIRNREEPISFFENDESIASLTISIMVFLGISLVFGLYFPDLIINIANLVLTSYLI